MDEQQAETNTTPTTAAPPDVVAVDTAPIAPPETLPPDPVVVTTDAVTPVVTEEIAPAEPETVPTVLDVVLEPIVPPPASVVEPATIAPTPIAPAPELPIIQVEQVTPVVVPSAAPESAAPEVQIVERVVEKVIEKEVIKEVPVEKIVEREVIKEVPVEKIVEKVVYRDREPTVCPPPTEEEREAIKRDFLIELSHEGTARKHALVAEKLEKILSLFETRERIMHKDVMDALDCSSTTATRLLTELRHEGKLLLHGQGGNSATYTRVMGK